MARFVVGVTALGACGGKRLAASADGFDDGGTIDTVPDSAGDECSKIVDIPSSALQWVSGALELTSFGTGFAILPSLVSSSDGALWLTTPHMGMGPFWSLERITTAGDVTEVGFAGTPPEDAGGPLGWMFRELAAGTEGSVWATEVEVFDFRARVTHTTPGGEVAVFPIDGVSRLGGIAAGTNGAVWFTEFGSREQLGVVTAAGQVNHVAWSIPWGEQVEPVDAIVAGPDGDVWFAEAPGHIGHMDDRGSVTELPLLSPTDTVSAIVVGMDRNLWFLGGTGEARTGNVLGRITPTGCRTEFRFHLTGGDGGRLAADRAGNLWIAAPQEIARFSPDHNIVEYALPHRPRIQSPHPDTCTDDDPACSPPQADAITLGPDDHLWFTESAESSVTWVMRVSAVR
jgi:streptogramin lyase